MKEIFAANVRALMLRDKQDETAAAKALKMRPFAFRRLLDGEHYPTLKTVQRVAETYDVEPYQLLVLNLNAKNPQVLRVLSPTEEKLYKAFEEARRELPPGTQ